MKKWTKGEIILSDLLIALAFVYIVPFLMMILGSFKAQSQAAMFNLELPKQWLISNYAHVLESGKILRGYLNSAIITIPVTVLSVLFGAVAGVVISRRNDRVTRGLYYYFIFGLTLTLQIASIFFLLKVLNIYGTFFNFLNTKWTHFLCNMYFYFSQNSVYSNDILQFCKRSPKRY